MSRPRIDREDELARMEQVCAGQAAGRILLVCASSGMGKSELLREFMARHAALRLAAVDFKGSGASLAALLTQIRDSFGRENFPAFSAAVLGSPANVNITQNIHVGNVRGEGIAIGHGAQASVGQNEISAALSAPDEHTRDMRRTALTEALFADLRALGPAVIVFDTYEKCDPEVKAWLASLFLCHAHRSAALTVILAGQQVPEATIEWEGELIELPGIAAEHWHRHAQAQGIPVDQSWVEGCCFAVNGKPDAMAQLLYARRQERHP